MYRPGRFSSEEHFRLPGAVVLLLGCCMAPCGGGGGTTPTNPGLVVRVAASLDGLDSRENLLEGSLRWDGFELDRMSYAEPQLNIGFVVDISSVQPGVHTLGIAGRGW